MPAWLMYRFVVRRMIRNPFRLGLVVAAVAAATTLIVSVGRVSIAGVQAFEESLGYSPDSYPLTVSPVGGRIPLASLGRCLAPLRESFSIAALCRESGTITTPRGSYPVTVVGITATDPNVGAPVTDEAILFSQQTLHALHLDRGSRALLSVRGAAIEGRVEIASALSASAASLSSQAALVPLTKLPPSTEGAVIDSLLLRPLNKTASNNLESARAEIQAWLSSCTEIKVPIQVETPNSRIGRAETLLEAYRLNVNILAAMTLLVCVLLVSQATQLSLRNLSGELSIVRTLGVSRGACVVAVLTEALFVSAMGATLGVTLGEPIILRITELLIMTAHDIYNISLSASTSSRLIERLLVVCGMVVLCVTGSLFGALGALRISPALGAKASFHHAQPIGSAWARFLAVSAVVVALSVTLCALLSSATWVAYLFVVACLLAVGCTTPFAIVTTPLILNRYSAAMSVWFARGAIKRNGSAFLFGAIGASISMTIICSLSLMVGSFRSTLERWSAQRLQGDLFISAPIDGTGNEARLDPHLLAIARNTPGVERAIAYYETLTSFNGAPLVVSASETGTQYDRGIYVRRLGSIDRRALESGRGALASESAARKLGITPGDQVTVDGRRFTILALIQEFGTEHPLLHIDQTAFLEMYAGHHPENLTIDIRTDAALSTVRNLLESSVGNGGIIRDNRELRTLVLQLFDQTFRITLSIRWIVFGIALLGMMLAAIQHLWERRREVKTMHVLGFTPRQIVSAQVAESAAVCALPTLVGALGGVAVGWGLTELVNPRSFGWSLDFTPSLTPIFVAVGFISGVAVVVGCATAALVGRTIREATLSDE